MGYKLFQCLICGKEVSRRKSVSLSELDGREGRACKHHPEVMEMIQKKADETEALIRLEADIKARLEAAAKEGERILRVIAASAYIRMTHTIYGTNPEVIYSNFRRNGMPEEMIEEVKIQVEKSGGPLMSHEELLSSIIAYSSVREG